mmetsp:Transcript_77533/g.240721  ORF Transcript_77533/g.240721 Transcript_77533/m.240721 type:complete len:211 (+) Transcript_77533:2378-3010(+)
MGLRQLRRCGGGERLRGQVSPNGGAGVPQQSGALRGQQLVRAIAYRHRQRLVDLPLDEAAKQVQDAGGDAARELHVYLDVRPAAVGLGGPRQGRAPPVGHDLHGAAGRGVRHLRHHVPAAAHRRDHHGPRGPAQAACDGKPPDTYAEAGVCSRLGIETGHLEVLADAAADGEVEGGGHDTRCRDVQLQRGQPAPQPVVVVVPARPGCCAC